MASVIVAGCGTGMFGAVRATVFSTGGCIVMPWRRKLNAPHGTARCWTNMSSLAQVASANSTSSGGIRADSSRHHLDAQGTLRKVGEEALHLQRIECFRSGFHG